jgi:opacity protein-like surface antigen
MAKYRQPIVLLRPQYDNMIYLMRVALVIGGLFFATASSHAQMKGWEVGGWVGAANYFGDLNTNWRFNRLHLAGSLGARYNFNDRLALRTGATYGKISATDADSKNIFEQTRNLNFNTIIVEASTQFEFNFMPYIHGHRDYYYTPYMFVGVGGYYFNPRTELNGETYNLVEMGTEGQFKGEEYNILQGTFTYGMGLRYDLSYRWSLNIEASARRLFTDYLDDVSGNYADPRDIRALRGDIAAQLADRSGEPQVGIAGYQRGNGKKNDTYMFMGVGVYYYFGRIRCPQMGQ